MTLEADLQTLLDPIASGGAWQDMAAQGTISPYIVWLQVVSPINNTLGGASNTQNTRVQIDCYGSSAAVRKLLADAVIAAMKTAPFKNIQLSSQNLPEPDTRLFRTMLDYSIWS